MRLFLIAFLFLLCCNCASDRKSVDDKIKEAPTRGTLSLDSQIFLGNRLFSEKTCITCHDIKNKKIGPSVLDIMRVYKEKNGNIVAFLKGKAEPIVDTTASQVAIMQDNINGFVRGLSDEMLNTIATYMMHVDELHTK
ncbi:c-type cytochrome [Aureibaculum algae]|uniref:C-type cytochrome n=1 Tax=Aureibaculum algae TaxID=2584122 RepID=A0A5B7TYM4_9FLAO|nr:c-type cytochrome [Aureibaculum algae]QCX39792.1 c-type cytochrome [Aureibaculum algae]